MQFQKEHFIAMLVTSHQPTSQPSTDHDDKRQSINLVPRRQVNTWEPPVPLETSNPLRTEWPARTWLAALDEQRRPSLLFNYSVCDVQCVCLVDGHLSTFPPPHNVTSFPAQCLGPPRRVVTQSQDGQRRRQANQRPAPRSLVNEMNAGRRHKPSRLTLGLVLGTHAAEG